MARATIATILAALASPSCAQTARTDSPLCLSTADTSLGPFVGSERLAVVKALFSPHSFSPIDAARGFDETSRMRYHLALMVAGFVLLFVLVLQRLCNTCGQMLYDPSVEDALLAQAVMGRVVVCQPEAQTLVRLPEDGEDMDVLDADTTRADAFSPIPWSQTRWADLMRCLLAATYMPLRRQLIKRLQPRWRLCVAAFTGLMEAPAQLWSFVSMPYSGVSPTPSPDHPSTSTTATTRAATTRARRGKAPLTLSALHIRIETMARDQQGRDTACVCASRCGDDQATTTCGRGESFSDTASAMDAAFPDAVAGGIPLRFTPSTADAVHRRPLLYTERGEWIPVVLRPFAVMQREMMGREAAVEYAYHHDALLGH